MFLIGELLGKKSCDKGREEQNQKGLQSTLRTDYRGRPALSLEAPVGGEDQM